MEDAGELFDGSSKVNSVIQSGLLPKNFLSKSDLRSTVSMRFSSSKTRERAIVSEALSAFIGLVYKKFNFR